MNYNLNNLFEYDLQESCVYVLKNNKRYRRIFPDEFYMVNVNTNGCKIRMKYSILIWSLVHKQRLKSNETILHKDLDENNNRIENLIKVTKKQKLEIKEALKNISGALRLVPHPTDLYCYVLEYRSAGRLRKELIQDIVPAKKRLSNLQLKFIKFLGKYIVSN